MIWSTSSENPLPIQNNDETIVPLRSLYIDCSRDEAIALLPERLMPMRHMLAFQPFIGGETPLFADYILFGALQWLRLTSGSLHLPADDVVAQWFERCLDLYQGAARAIA